MIINDNTPANKVLIDSFKIDNMLTTFNLNKRNVECSAHTINMAMSLFLTHKKLYDHLRDSILLSLPHPIMLNNLSNDMKVLLGGDPSIYLIMKDEIEKLDNDIIGHIMMDEIKLKNGISYNCNNKEV